MLDGYRTYTGLVIALLGLVGVSKFFAEGELEVVISIVIQLAGLLFAAYGRYKATCK